MVTRLVCIGAGVLSRSSPILGTQVSVGSAGAWPRLDGDDVALVIDFSHDSMFVLAGASGVSARILATSTAVFGANVGLALFGLDPVDPVPVVLTDPEKPEHFVLANSICVGAKILAASAAVLGPKKLSVGGLDRKNGGRNLDDSEPLVPFRAIRISASIPALSAPLLGAKEHSV